MSTEIKSLQTSLVQFAIITTIPIQLTTKHFIKHLWTWTSPLASSFFVLADELREQSIAIFLWKLRKQRKQEHFSQPRCLVRGL